MVELLLLVVGLLVAGYLAVMGRYWWLRGSEIRNRTAFTTRGFGKWRERIDDARAQLAEMQTPGWYERQWPICDDLDVSSNGEYCRRCFRPVWRHGAGGVDAMPAGKVSYGNY